MKHFYSHKNHLKVALKTGLLVFFIYFLCPSWCWGQINPRWRYIQVDSTKQKWGDWDNPDWLRYFGLDAGDIDQDGDYDILSGRYIYRNPGEKMNEPWERLQLQDNVDGIFIMDIDNDPFIDIVAQALPNIYWYEAIDSMASAFKRVLLTTVPATGHVNSQGFKKAQIIRGGSEEILIAGNGNVYLIDLANKSNQLPVKAHLIAANTSDEGIGVGDIDADGDMDIACGRRAPGQDEPLILVWFENPGNNEAPWKDRLVTTTEHPIDRVEIADINGDFIQDIIIAEERYPGLAPDANLFWIKQQSLDEWQKQLIVTQFSMNNLSVADIDDDGDMDILTAEHKGQQLSLQLWRNEGSGNFEMDLLDTGKENHLGAQWIDLDRDGNLDIIGAGWDQHQFVHVWMNELPPPSKPRKSAEASISKTVYQGRSHYVVKTKRVTYYYDKEGGGFSSIIDPQGKDWISFHTDREERYPKSATTSFRGLPNLVFQGKNNGAGHPGFNRCISWIEEGKIVTQTKDGLWKWQWSFQDDHSRLSILKTDDTRRYWFLYEGTPGGNFIPEESYFGSNISGPSHDHKDFYKGEYKTGNFQWMYAGRDGYISTFYMLHEQEDELGDLISLLGGSEKGLTSQDGMTVWGFGRDTNTQPLLKGKQSFVIGFYPNEINNEEDHKQFSKYVEDKYNIK